MNTSESKEDLTPDDLLTDFRKSSLMSIVVFTIAVHAILLLGTSIPYLWRTFVGPDASNLTEEQRTEKAMKEATESLRKIASEHGLKPQDLSEQLGSGSRPTRATDTDPASESEGTNTPEDPGDPLTAEADPSDQDPSDPDEPKTAIEKELEVKTTGPSLPPVPDDDEDLFK